MNTPIKIGSRVVVTRRNGDRITGRVTRIDTEANGPWYVVEYREEGTRIKNQLRARLSALSRPTAATATAIAAA